MATIFFETSTQLAAAATYDGSSSGAVGGGSAMIRDAGIAPDEARSFGAQVNTDQAGTLYIFGSFDKATWRQCGSVATDGTKPYDLDVPIRFRYYCVRYTNGSTQTGAGNFGIHSSFRT